MGGVLGIFLCILGTERASRQALQVHKCVMDGKGSTTVLADVDTHYWDWEMEGFSISILAHLSRSYFFCLMH